MTVRKAYAQDVGRIVEMAERFARESEYKTETTWNHDAISDTVANLVANPSALVVVAEDGAAGTLLGMIVLTLYRHPFSGEMAASELAWWVEPEARRGGAGLELLRVAEAWAANRGAKVIQMIAPNERVGALYSKLGYTQLETWFQRRL